MANEDWETTRRDEMRKLVAEIEDEGGLKTVTMARLRDTAGWDRLGPRTLTDIANLLDEHDVGFLPANETLPLSREASVRLYNRRHPIGGLVQAVLSPSARGDDLLKEAASNDAAAVLERVRRLVCTTP